MTTKKQELDNIVEQFNIQVENPVCFLNQETSKHFLNSSNTGDKYKLFMKASQLEAMKQLQEQIGRETQTSLKLITEKESFLPMLEADLYKAEDLYKKCQSVDKLRDKQRRLMREHVWAVVIEAEKELEAFQREKSKVVKSKEKIVEKIDEAKAAYLACLPEFERAKANVAAQSKASDEIGARGQVVETEFRQVSGQYKSTLLDIRKQEAQIEKKTKSKAELVNKLNEDKKNSRIDYEEEKRNKDAKVGEFKSKIKETYDLGKLKTQEALGYKATVDQNTKKINDLNFAVTDNERAIKNLNSDIEKFRRAKSDQLVRFGEFMPNLVGEVHRQFNAGKFKQKPLGPIGMYLQPREDKWTLAIEQCIAGTLMAFVCGNYEDERLMHQLIAKHVQLVHKRPRVIVTNFDTPLYDVSRYVSNLWKF